jgi:pseudoazurin
MSSAIFASISTRALAADFQVKMLNKGADGAMVFEPALTKVAKGDTVTFIPVDKGHHVETVKGIIPEGAAEFRAKTNESYKAVFEKDGAYVLKCPPHFGMGMVAIVIVGDASANLDAIKTGTLPSKARERVDAALKAAGL